MTTIRDATQAAALGTVLGVWAHPDDEAYLSAGLMALARDAGSPVTCITATRGEHGTDDPDRWPPARLARVRELEAAACMAVLGVDDHRFLDHEDGTLAGVDPEAGVSAVADVIAELRPDTIVTFGPDGMTGHDDHRTVSAWASEAWWRQGRRGRLLHATTTASFADEFAELHRQIPVFGPGLPLRTPEVGVAMAVELDDAQLDRKLAALRAHASQTHPLIDQLGAERFRRWWRTETFRDASGYASRTGRRGDGAQDLHHVAGALRGGARRHRRARRWMAPAASGWFGEAPRARTQPAAPS